MTFDALIRLGLLVAGLTHFGVLVESSSMHLCSITKIGRRVADT